MSFVVEDVLLSKRGGSICDVRTNTDVLYSNPAEKLITSSYQDAGVFSKLITNDITIENNTH